MSDTSRQPRRASARPTSSTSSVSSSDARAGPAREPQWAHGWSHFIVSSQTAFSGLGTSPSSARRLRTGAGLSSPRMRRRLAYGPASLPPAPPAPPAEPVDDTLCATVYAAAIDVVGEDEVVPPAPP